MPAREIRIANRCERLRCDPAEVEGWIRALDACGAFPIPAGDLSVVFLADSEMAELHGTYLGDPLPTDVITFPGDPEFEEAGEICIGAEQAFRVCARHGNTLPEEILLYIAHGWLHLAGLDDHSESDRAAMRAAEEEILSRAREGVRTPEFSWRGNRP